MAKVSKVTITYEVKIYVGSKEGYHGTEFSEERLLEAVTSFQAKHAFCSPVRLTRTRFVRQDYNECGWEICVTNYPRSPKTKVQVRTFSSELASHLLEVLKQKTISMVCNNRTSIFEAE